LENVAKMSSEYLELDHLSLGLYDRTVTPSYRKRPRTLNEDTDEEPTEVNFIYLAI